MNDVRDQILTWYANVCRRPTSKQPPAWQPERLNYRFETRCSTDSRVEFGDLDLWTQAGEVKRKGIRVTACDDSDILVGGFRLAQSRTWKRVLVCQTGVRIALPEPVRAVEVTYGWLGQYGRLGQYKHSVHGFDEDGGQIQLAVHQKGAERRGTVQLDRKGNLVREVPTATYSISGRNITKIEIRGRGQITLATMNAFYQEGTRLVALDYRNGDIDWYTFSAGSEGVRGPWVSHTHPEPKPAGRQPFKPEDDQRLKTERQPVDIPPFTTPTRIEIAGTSPRWWAFEDGNTDFGAMDVAKPDLAKLMLMEFVLIYGDDWFSVPAPVSIGSLVKIDELKVWNVFGDEITINPARRIEGDSLERFDLFTLSETGKPREPGIGYDDIESKVVHPILYVPPVTGFRQESPPLDEVLFLRDEGANMVWGVEHTVPNGLGRPVSGFDAQRECMQRERDQKLEQLAQVKRKLEYGAPSGEDSAVLEATVADLQNQIADLSPYARPTPSQDEVPRYRLATTVPENWIPFIPVRRGSIIGARQAAIQFRRAKMLRNFDHKKMENDPTMTLSKLLAEDESISAMSRLLALDEDALLFINEESVPRAGVRVQLTKQRVRWVDGSTHVWLGRKVLTGRGEGHSP